ncbi:MAG: class II D-tagatose-bisphosphate aldolase, non-catalytic subunit [Nitrososphaeria archaeon]|nr:class II D-tagatose-bisphosphate aldolase, non-catalytic subunit [Nitrososphaeria archaeon]
MKEVPVIELLLKVVDELSCGLERRATLLGICPVSRSTIRTSIECAKLLNFPLMFVATLNQVDIDGGYTGLTPRDFVNLVKRECEELDFSGPTIIALDHGGPWLKDKHVAEKFGWNETVEWVKKSIEACIKAGYDLLHIDTTVDIRLKDEEGLSIDTVAMRTADLIEYAEEVAKENEVPRLSYEVGTEEVHGGITSPEHFTKFITKLREELRKRNLENVWPCFIVGNVGTFLTPVNKFNPEKARTLVEIAKTYGLYVKGHYTDYVSNPEEYPKSGMGGANIGPELAHAEYIALEELAQLEGILHDRGQIQELSRITEKLDEAVIKSGRWMKWLTEEEKFLEFNQLPENRRKWLLGTGARYVLSSPGFVQARSRLQENLRRLGADLERVVMAKLRDVLWKYAHAFNLVDLMSELNIRLAKRI